MTTGRHVKYPVHKIGWDGRYRGGGYARTGSCRAHRLVILGEDRLATMLGFLVKKAFFDTWDNLFRVLLLNIGFYAPIALLVYAPVLTPVLPLTLLLQVVALALFCIYTGGASAVTSAIADYQSPDFATFWQAIQDTYPTTLLFALLNSVYFVILSVAFRVYAVVDQQLLGFLGQVILLWVTVGWVLAAQLFFPIQSRLERNPRKMMRKMLLLFFDNTGLMIFLAAGALVTLVASVFTGGILPGLGAVLVWHNVALKLRLYKYDYLEQHPESNRKQIPWDALLVDDRDRVGKRTLRGMIFPWKE